MVPSVSLTLFWAVLTPLVLFLVLLPGYVLVCYVRHRYLRVKSRKSSRLINKERVIPYYAEIRPILIERLQKRTSLNIPGPTTNGVKPARKHLRSSSTQLTGSPVKSLFQNRHCRRNSSPVVVSQQRMEVLEPYCLYQVQPSYSHQPFPILYHKSQEEMRSEKLSPPPPTPVPIPTPPHKTTPVPPSTTKSWSTTNKNGKSRHLPSQGTVPTKLRFSPTGTGQTSPLGEGKPDLPEIIGK